jgi:hypothetical protein
MARWCPGHFSLVSHIPGAPVLPVLLFMPIASFYPESLWAHSGA